MKKLTQKRLKELLHYDPNTGIFTRKITTDHRAQKGNVAGWTTSHKYIAISVDNHTYYAHRLAWLYVYGYFPENDIDHKDQIKYHNWIDNLREVSRSCNIKNTNQNRSDNTSGIKGVCKNNNKWLAYINIDKKHKYLGEYKTFDNAVCARLAAEQCLDWSRCNSKSSAYQYVQRMLKKKKFPKIVV